MAVKTCELEIATPIPPAKLFKAFILEQQTFLPKVQPEEIRCVQVIEGDGGVGTIKKIIYGDGSPSEYMMERTDAIDKENLTYSFTVFEGDFMAGKIEKITNDIKFIAGPDGGTIWKCIRKYHTIGDFEVKDEDIMDSKQKSIGVFKIAETYLMGNPDADA